MLAIVLRVITQPTSAIVPFYVFFYGSANVQIWAVLTRSHCRVSDTQVTGKAFGPLGFLFLNLNLMEKEAFSLYFSYNNGYIGHIF